MYLKSGEHLFPGKRLDYWHRTVQMNALIPLCQLTSLLGLHNKRPCGHLKDAPICPGSTTALGLAQPGPAEQLSTHTPQSRALGQTPELPL